MRKFYYFFYERKFCFHWFPLSLHWTLLTLLTPLIPRTSLTSLTPISQWHPNGIGSWICRQPSVQFFIDDFCAKPFPTFGAGRTSCMRMYWFVLVVFDKNCNSHAEEKWKSPYLTKHTNYLICMWGSIFFLVFLYTRTAWYYTIWYYIYYEELFLFFICTPCLQIFSTTFTSQQLS